jgi:hypothetical protein
MLDDPDVQALWQLWLSLWEHNDRKMVLSPKRLDCIIKAIETYGYPECEEALLGYREDDWKPRHRELRNHDLTVLFRDEEHVERGRDIYTRMPASERLRRLSPLTALARVESWPALFDSNVIYRLLAMTDWEYSRMDTAVRRGDMKLTDWCLHICAALATDFSPAALAEVKRALLAKEPPKPFAELDFPTPLGRATVMNLGVPGGVAAPPPEGEAGQGAEGDYA